MGRPVIVPRDSLTLPAPPALPESLALGTTIYRAVPGGLSAVRADGSVDIYRLPPFESDVLAFLASVNNQRADTTTLEETTGPLIAPRGLLYFGLTLRDTATGLTLGGIGWFNPATLQTGRLYNGAMLGMHPAAIVSRADTLLCVFRRSGADSLTESHIIRYPLGTTNFDEVAWQRAGIPGTRLLNAAAWGDTLLLATDSAIAVWKPQRMPAVWQTRAWAASEPRWLYLRTASTAAADTAPPYRFLLLRANLAVEVEAQDGPWLQVVAPFGLDGYVTLADWENHGVLWSQRRWHCGETPCFARVRVPVKRRAGGNRRDQLSAHVCRTAIPETGSRFASAQFGFTVKISRRSCWRLKQKGLSMTHRMILLLLLTGLRHRLPRLPHPRSRRTATTTERTSLDSLRRGPRRRSIPPGWKILTCSRHATSAARRTPTTKRAR